MFDDPCPRHHLLPNWATNLGKKYTQSQWEHCPTFLFTIIFLLILNINLQIFRQTGNNFSLYCPIIPHHSILSLSSRENCLYLFDRQLHFPGAIYMLIHVAGMWEDTSTKQRKGVCIYTPKKEQQFAFKNMFCKTPNCWVEKTLPRDIPQMSRWLRLDKTIDKPMSEFYHFWLQKWLENFNFLLRINSCCSPISTLNEEIPASQMGKWPSVLWRLTSNWQRRVSLTHLLLVWITPCHIPARRNLLSTARQAYTHTSPPQNFTGDEQKFA